MFTWNQHIQQITTPQLGKGFSANTTGASNVAVGTSALGAATTASGNTAVGINSADAITTGYHNVALGGFALSANVTGNQNVAIGTSLYLITLVTTQQRLVTIL